MERAAPTNGSTQGRSLPRLLTPSAPWDELVYGPGMQSLDFALVRSFPLKEHMALEARGEVFNSMNHVNLDTPNRFVNTAGFGTITDAMDPARQIQLSARLTF